MLYGTEVVPATLLDVPRRPSHARPSLSGAQAASHHEPRRLRAHACASAATCCADFAARRERIRAQVAALAATLNGRALIREALLDEVTALVEWPVALAGRFEARFLALPREVLISTLQEHQRYFPVEDAQGRLLPAFITVSNIESRDPAKVREGNERVVRPRLADAAFFWEQDRKQPLAARARGARCGDLPGEARLARRQDARACARSPARSPRPSAAVRAARRARRGALQVRSAHRHGRGVSRAAGHHGHATTRWPTASRRGRRRRSASTTCRARAGDALPATRAGLAVALADKLDTLAGIFAIGEKPTGTKDPFGLRRAAIGVLRILIEKALDLDLRRCIDRRSPACAPTSTDCAAGERRGRNGAGARGARHAGSGQPGDRSAPRSPLHRDDIYDFIMERLRAYYLEARRAAASAAGRASPPRCSMRCWRRGRARRWISMRA